MPRFKNTGLVPVVVGDGIPVAPGGFLAVADDDVDDTITTTLVQVPDALPPTAGDAASGADQGNTDTPPDEGDADADKPSRARATRQTRETK